MPHGNHFPGFGNRLSVVAADNVRHTGGRSCFSGSVALSVRQVKLRALGHDDHVRAGSHHGADAHAAARYYRNLGHNAGKVGGSGKDFAVRSQNFRALAEFCAVGIVNCHNGRAVFHSQIVNFRNFLRVRFGNRAAQGGDILGKSINHIAVHAAIAGNDADALLAAGHKRIQFHEGSFVKQRGNAVPGRGGFLESSLFLCKLFQLGLISHCIAPILYNWCKQLSFLNLTGGQARCHQIHPVYYTTP